MKPGAIKAETSRLRRRLAGLRRDRAALELAVAQFTDDDHIDAELWDAAFTSIDPEETNRVRTVTGGYVTLVNNCVEMLKTGARLGGLVAGRRPRAEDAIEAARSDGGLTDEQAELLHELYVLEGRLEHASPDVVADEVREAVETWLAELPGLTKAIVAWLSSHGLDLSD